MRFSKKEEYLRQKDKKLKKIIDENYIVISGDYGAWGDTTYCKEINSRLFIANGIGDTKNDTIIKIYDFKNSLFIEEININN
tara:strand:+ start:471 stop:716 length:246 start_codon:yes stop_codon:yes gene_type:complete